MFDFFKTNNCEYKKHKAFTMSETLITLVITGVVFTLSLGTMIADYHKNQTVVRLKKAYSVLSQTMNMALAKNGPPHTWNIREGIGDYATNLVFSNYIEPNMIVLRNCNNSMHDQCDYVFKELDGTEKSLNSTWTRFFLNDGMFVAVQSRAEEGYKVLYFYVDTNGKKRLNVVARDIFMFEYWIENELHPEYVGRILPYGHEYSRDELISEDNPNNCNKNTSGNYCSSLIMTDDWQIISGYPWAQARYVVQ